MKVRRYLFPVSCFLFPILLCGCVSLMGAKRKLVPTEPEIDKLYEQRFIKSQAPKSLPAYEDEMDYNDYNYKSLLQLEYNPRYYMPKDPNKALMLSIAFPGLGQAYSENYKKGMSFLVMETLFFATTAHNLNRAHYYNSMSKKFLRFYDKFNGFYLSSDEGEAWAKKHLIMGSVYMISLGGLHLWNAFDAKRSAEGFNSKRNISIQLEAAPSKAVVKIGNGQWAMGNGQ